MSEKECVLRKGGQDDALITRDQLFDSTSSSSSSNGSTGCSSSSSLDCSSTDLQGSALSSPLAALHSAPHPCTLQPPLHLPSADIKLPPPLLNLQSSNIKPPSSPPAPLTFPRKVEHGNGAVKRSMGLMKLRRQGSHPPASNKSCHGSFNQAAAARELMASLERLSMKKTMGMNEEREGEAQRALLTSEGEESLNAAAAGRRNAMKTELPLTTKIAAAMDAEGLIGVQEEIALQCNEYKSRSGLRSLRPDQYASPSSFKAKFRVARRPAAAAGRSGDHEARARNMHSTLPKRRSRWIILRRLSSSRALLRKIWIKFKRTFKFSRKHLQKQVLKVSA